MPRKAIQKQKQKQMKPSLQCVLSAYKCLQKHIVHGQFKLLVSCLAQEQLAQLGHLSPCTQPALDYQVVCGIQSWTPNFERASFHLAHSLHSWWLITRETDRFLCSNSIMSHKRFELSWCPKHHIRYQNRVFQVSLFIEDYMVPEILIQWTIFFTFNFKVL